MSRPPCPPVPSPTPAPGELVAAQRRAGRSALFGLALLGLGMLASPLLAWREDLLTARAELAQRLSDQASVQAEALGVHLGLLQAELQRLAHRPELSPMDGKGQPPVELLAHAFHHSALFSEGVALLTPSGERVWSDPATMPLGDSPLVQRTWFRKVLSERRPDIGLLEGEGGPVVVAVPVMSGDRLTGLLVGELRAGARPLPGAHATGDATALLLDSDGRLLLPVPAPAWADAEDLGARLAALARVPGPLTLGQVQLMGAAAPVGATGLLLAVLEEEEKATSGLRRRLVGQLFFHTALLLSTLLLFAFLLRRSYRALLSAEERLRHQETMAALGAASQLIAHEVKNALNGIQAALSMLRPAASGGEVALPALRAQIHRLGHLARSLLSFGAPRAAHRRACELGHLVNEALQTVRLLPESEDVAVQTSLTEGLTVQADPALLVAAIDNLVRNAVEAGAVARDTGLRPSPWVRVTLAREGEEAVLVVEDNAGGVDRNLEPRLWEPFATARAKGVGLGLPMARASVEAHGGRLTFTRLPDGSRFTLRLPLESAGTDSPAQDGAETDGAGSEDAARARLESPRR